jgi:glycolate oxidase
MDKNSMLTVEKFYPSGLNTEKEAMLLIEIEGFAVSLSEQQKRVESALQKANATDIITVNGEKEKEDIWTARRASFAATAKLAPDVLSDDIIVPRSNLAKMINGAKEICNKHNLQVCIVGHVGDGNIHPQVALNLDNDEEYKNYLDAKAEMYNLAVSLGGTISAEHGVGIEKISYMENIVDSNSIEYMKRVKKLFDPKNILNPGKVIKL